MLSIFRSKKYLVDQLNEFIDIHNHLLPGIDDGASSTEESLQLIQGMLNLGITHFICTPHTMEDYHPNTPQTILKSKELLLKSLSDSFPNPPHIHASSEYMLDTNFLKILKEKTVLPLKDNYLLVEMSYLQPPLNLEEILFEITSLGYQPVLAHPERYMYLHNNYSYYKELKRLGFNFQLNMLALGNYYGSAINRVAYKLLQNNLYDFIGSDLHNEKHLSSLKSVKVGQKDLIFLETIIANTKTTFSV